ncbi:MAG: sel1 repeat family protein, partial [Opitutaceae bacterium]|nr:sel1 repeat family protein [Opitutaceae bacterium]
LWVSDDGDEAQAWRRVPVEHNAFLELTGDRLVAATPEGLMVRDAGALTFAESRPTRVARSLATNASWQAAGPAAVAERKKQEVLAKAAADAIPPTVAGAVEMAKAFHHFERLYVSGAPRRDLAQQVVGVHEAVRKHRPQLADEVAEVLSVLVVNLEVRDARTTAFLAHHLPGFRKKVQARYGKVYSQIYWSLKRQPGAGPTQQEYEVDVMKELLMSHTDNSYLRRVTFPKVPQGYPNYDADKPRQPVEFAAVPDAPFDAAEMLKNLVEKGWAGAALDRDVMHANKLQIEASTAMRHVWLLAARALWPGTPPASADDLLKRSKEEKARLGSLFATDGLALDARKAGRTDEFTRYRDLAVQRGMRASRYVSYAEQMADALRAVNEADRNMAAALGDYADQVSAATGGTDPVSRLVNQFPGNTGAPAGPAPSAAILSEGEEISRDIELKNAEAKPAGKAREEALAEHRAKWDEKIRFRKLALQLKQAAGMPDAEADGFLRTATLQGIAKSSSALFGTTPRFVDNRLQLASLFTVVQNTVPRERHASILDRILRDVPTLADVWVLRAGCHLDASEWSLAEGSLAVARLLNPNEPSLGKMETRLDAQRPALTNEDIIRQRFARIEEEAEASTDAMLRSADPAADYATGLEFEQGKKGGDIKERIDKAKFHYLKAALADHVPAMLGYVRVANASLQQPGVSETTRAAVEKGIVQWVNKAADLGNGEALRVRAQWRANGQAGLTADRGLAWLELERAAEAGDWPAMRLLAQAAHAGEWGRQDFKVVENWLERARAAGDPEAGRMLEELRKQHQSGKK